MCDLNPGIVGALVQSVVFPLPQEAFEAGWDETNMYPTDREFWLRCLAYVSVQVGVAASVMGLAFLTSPSQISTPLADPNPAEKTTMQKSTSSGQCGGLMRASLLLRLLLCRTVVVSALSVSKSSRVSFWDVKLWREGVEHVLRVPEGMPVLQAAEAAGLMPTSECRRGNCLSCGLMPGL